MPAILAVAKAARTGGVPQTTLELVHPRAGRINGCSYRVIGGIAGTGKNGESDERLHAVAAWREVPYLTDAERAALELAEHVTRLADRAVVPDDAWNAAAHFDEKQLASLVLWISLTNLFNRLHATTRQPAAPPGNREIGSQKALWVELPVQPPTRLPRSRCSSAGID
ncbi:carboxymuconolactone decarboxylase family protein [Kitasatospora sp. NPDC088351]|uniref:carboxymuconolactone decarboxylase family protein n=1 Tax=unclassified Kitasatospora TaxID=2633591 RepID=UPI003431DBD7